MPLPVAVRQVFGAGHARAYSFGIAPNLAPTEVAPGRMHWPGRVLVGPDVSR